MHVPLTPTEARAIQQLCGHSLVATDLLNPAADDYDMKKEAGDPTADYRVRLARLSQELRSYLVSMAAEKVELGDEEERRLGDEAVGLLIALRDLHRYFPEVK